MKFGQTFALRTARGKLGVSVALILFGLIAVLAAPTTADRLLCTLVPLGGAVVFILGLRQDRSEKNAIRNDDKEAK